MKLKFLVTFAHVTVDDEFHRFPAHGLGEDAEGVLEGVCRRLGFGGPTGDWGFPGDKIIDTCKLIQKRLLMPLHFLTYTF